MVFAWFVSPRRFALANTMHGSDVRGTAPCEADPHRCVRGCIARSSPTDCSSSAPERTALPPLHGRICADSVVEKRAWLVLADNSAACARLAGVEAVVSVRSRSNDHTADAPRRCRVVCAPHMLVPHTSAATAPRAHRARRATQHAHARAARTSCEHGHRSTVRCGGTAATHPAAHNASRPTTHAAGGGAHLGSSRAKVARCRAAAGVCGARHADVRCARRAIAVVQGARRAARGTRRAAQSCWPSSLRCCRAAPRASVPSTRVLWRACALRALRGVGVGGGAWRGAAWRSSRIRGGARSLVCCACVSVRGVCVCEWTCACGRRGGGSVRGVRRGACWCGASGGGVRGAACVWRAAWRGCA